MAEYTEKEAVGQAVLELPGKIDEDGYIWVLRRDAFRAVDDFPAANVRENVKAEWVNREVFTAKGHVDMLQSAFCPNCKRYHTTPYSYYFTDYAFCPNCGAKMDGEEEP